MSLCRANEIIDEHGHVSHTDFNGHQRGNYMMMSNRRLEKTE